MPVGLCPQMITIDTAVKINGDTTYSAGFYRFPLPFFLKLRCRFRSVVQLAATISISLILKSKKSWKKYGAFFRTSIPHLIKHIYVGSVWWHLPSFFFDRWLMGQNGKKSSPRKMEQIEAIFRYSLALKKLPSVCLCEILWKIWAFSGSSVVTQVLLSKQKHRKSTERAKKTRIRFRKTHALCALHYYVAVPIFTYESALKHIPKLRYEHEKQLGIYTVSTSRCAKGKAELTQSRGSSDFQVLRFTDPSAHNEYYMRIDCALFVTLFISFVC